MAEKNGQKKLVEAITPMEEDFAKWYTPAFVAAW